MYLTGGSRIFAHDIFCKNLRRYPYYGKGIFQKCRCCSGFSFSPHQIMRRI